MRLYPRCAVVLMFLLVPTTALASDHVASLYGGYSALSGSYHNGLQFGLEVSWPTNKAGIHDHVGILVDAAVHGGTDDDGIQFTKSALLFGLRGLYKLPRAPRLVLFAHGLIGAHRTQTGTQRGTQIITAPGDHGWAGGAGVGFDVLLGSTGYSGWATRTQLEWVNVAGVNSARFSTGVVFRFKEAPKPPKP